MKIVHLLWSMDLKDGGVVRAILDLCPMLSRNGHEVVLLTSRDADVPGDWKGAGAPGRPRCVLLPPRGIGRTYGRRALAIIREQVRDADVLHLHGMWMTCNDQAARIARRLGVPYIISPHGMLDDWCMAQRSLKKRAYLALGGASNLANAAVIHCTAPAELEQAGKWFPRRLGVVVPLPFDLSDYRDLPGPQEARDRFALGSPDQPGYQPVILFLSRIDRKKGLEVLIRSVSRLRADGVAARLVIAGGGEQHYVDSLRALVDQSGLRDSTIFAGFVSGKLKVSLYQAAEVFCLPSSQENFGYVVVEALAARTPVITTRGVALWPTLESERAAALVEPTVDELVPALRSALTDRAAALASAARGRDWCMHAFEHANIAAGFDQMYAQAARTARVPAEGRQQGSECA